MKTLAAFSGFSVRDLAEAGKFYKKLGLKIEEQPGGMGLKLHLPGGGSVFVYDKEDHEPATFTIMNFVVKDIDAAVDDLVAAGVEMEHYDDMPFKQDKKGIARGLAAKQGPNIAWFKDPSDNILAVLQAE